MTRRLAILRISFLSRRLVWQLWQEAPPVADQTLATLAAAQAGECVGLLWSALRSGSWAGRGAGPIERDLRPFLPPKEDGTLDDLFLYCDLDAVGLDVVTGRATFASFPWVSSSAMASRP